MDRPVTNAPQRTPLLAGAPNLRDLGGYRASDGQQVRHGLVYRSEGLSGLDEDDLDVAAGLGIRLICDIRSDRERTHLPTRWPDTSVETLRA